MTINFEPTYTNEELLKEWNTIKVADYSYDSGCHWNKLIKKFQYREFYKKELELWTNNPMYQGFPLQSWIYINRLKYIDKSYKQLTAQEILRAFKITGLHIGNSFHSPFYIKQFCKDYKIQSIYDPCGGWGHRMLGASAIGCAYLYNDINEIAMKNCQNLASFLSLSNVQFSCQDSAKYKPEFDYEAVFTCPPYHCVEHYTDEGSENLSYEDFLSWWKQTIQISCIEKHSCKYFAFIINRTYEQDMLSCCLDLGLTSIQEQILGSSKAVSHLAQNTNKYEKLLVLKK